MRKIVFAAFALSAAALAGCHGKATTDVDVNGADAAATWNEASNDTAAAADQAFDTAENTLDATGNSVSNAADDAADTTGNAMKDAGNAIAD